ncbi:hypothetical protein L1987_85781 [Smallanthus sonchifolius]|uniref:Uncharacterized protein n=1 Tax=Smallanthus sonchifolius TaxID=185202 RepID=A0ACB8XYQ3_9ASTR|nr:hypothetical protein L1987_85781 [Smallanthus sonchifolius]
MGRQKGDAARSKARPSSSSLAASLLPSGATAVGFGGYVGSSRLDTCIPTTSSDTSSSLLDIDGELAQHLKRLSRKDPTTKLKALTTLSTLLKDKSAKDVSPIIPQWAFEYKKLLQDYNREVRRATHDTMATLVSTVGRDLAPHLKSLMGPWWFSQFDTVHEVSQAAKRSLQAAFPAQEKRLDALMLCTDEVFMYLEENLKLTPQSMSDKAVALDELQEMHQQVISASLVALATLIDILTNEKHGLENSSSEQKHTLKARSAAISHAEKLLSVHKCLDFLKSHSSAIRSAAYSLVGSCVKNIPHALNEANIKTLAPAILGAFQEKVPTCHSSMWEAVLMFSRKFPQSWTSLNVHKTVLNRFWNFLRNGCIGSQQVSYPALVLFLDCIPPKVITVDKFLLEFFQNFWAGKIHSQSSNADQLAFFQSFRECSLWVLQNAQRYYDGVEAVHQFRCTIVEEVLLKMMWHDYLLVPSSEEKMKKIDSKYQVGHVQEFGKCITEILSGIFSLEPNLLSVFALAFEENCLDAFQQSENSESCENVDKIIRFLLSVDLHAVRRGDSWPLSSLVGPVLSKSFHLSIFSCGSSDAWFVCAALGGKTEDDQIYLVSENTAILIFEEIFQKLRSFIGASNFTWVKCANNELSKAKEHVTIEGCTSSTSVLQMANYAMEVLNGSFYRLINLAKNSTLLPHVLAALFVIDWEHGTSAVFYEGLADEVYAEVMDRYSFCKFVHTFRRKIDKFLKTLSLDCRSMLGSTLVQAIRSVTLNFEINSSDASENSRMAAFVDKLISKVGIARVIAGFTSSKEVMTCHSDYARAWLASEMLCTWKWQGGSALTSFLPSLVQYIRTQPSSPGSDNLLDSIVNFLIDGAIIQGANSEMSCSSIYSAPHDELESIEHVFLRALMSILHTLFEDDIWGRSKALGIFNLLVDRLFVGEIVNSNCLKVLVVVMSVLVGPLFGDEVTDSSEKNEVHDVIEGWLQKTLTFPPLNTWLSGEDMENWFHLVVSCYPLRGRQQFRPQRYMTHVEHGLLLELLRKQRLGSTSATLNKLPVVQMLLSKLTVVVVGYCWSDFNQDDWDFVLYKSTYWIESSVVLMEEVAESVNETITNGPTSEILENLQHTVLGLNSSSLKLATNALVAFSIFCRLVGQNTVENENENDQNPLRPGMWELTKDKILQGILRLLFSTGAAEAIAGSYSSMASSVIASSRLGVCYLWELVSSCAVESSSHARVRAVKSFDIWGLSKGAVSSLYAILFSSKPVLYLQYAAYVILSSEPVADLAFVTQETSSLLNENDIDDKDPPDLSLETKIQLREEISIFLEKSPFEIIELDLVAPDRVHVFVAWSLLISHLLSLPSSPTKEKLIQHIKDSSSDSIILDCIFQHIPLELCAESVKKKFSQLPAGISEFSQAATRAITDNSVLFAVQSLWPVGTDGMASFAGAIYGLMLRTLPAYVRDWFSDIRDHTSSSAIEFFTRTCCSPHLITYELSQIKKADLCDENFSVSVSKSANEVVATYTKDESNMALVVRLPSSYSLRPVDVECTRSLGISEVKQRKWLLSMILFVRNQNGGLAEAIRIWKNNFDKEFEGVEECPICYSVIHTSNHSLPRRACRTCKHKFHAACLYKWFLTSNKSNCPLCQSLF